MSPLGAGVHFLGHLSGARAVWWEVLRGATGLSRAAEGSAWLLGSAWSHCLHLHLTSRSMADISTLSWHCMSYLVTASLKNTCSL